jgi:hypothetical protein
VTHYSWDFGYKHDSCWKFEECKHMVALVGKSLEERSIHRTP